MAVEMCDLCQVKHESNNWRIYSREGTLFHICDGHFKAQHPDSAPESVKEDRKKYAKSLIQPWREGEPSAEFIEAYPEQAKKMFTLKERMKARNVWMGEPNYANWRKSK